MPMLRRVSTESQQPKMLLESVNPYESRRLTVEFDGVTTAAYLHDETSTVAATWIANHVPAPASPDPARIEAGQAPIMPSGHTKLPEGRPPIEPGTLEPLWFEEGDGVAVLENGKLLAVIPGWSDGPGSTGSGGATSDRGGSSSRGCSGTWSGSAPAAITGTRRWAGSRWPASASAPRLRTARTRCCPRSG